MDINKIKMNGFYNGFEINEVVEIYKEKINEMIERIDEFKINEFF